MPVQGELGAIGRALDAAAVEHAVLKGLPLAVRLTGRIDGRQRRIRDTDVLLRQPTEIREGRAERSLPGYFSKAAVQEHALSARPEQPKRAFS